MTKPVVVLDACVLVPIRLATTLLWLAEAGLFQPMWSEQILDEVRRNLPKVGVAPDKATHRVAMMRSAFEHEAMVEGFEDLLDGLTCDFKDRHVLAAAIRGGAETILTYNLSDFPESSVSPHDVAVQHPDAFLTQLLAEESEVVMEVLKHQMAARRSPPETVRDFLAALTATAPMFANLAADQCVDGPVARSDVAPLVTVDDEQARASLGEPGDLYNPAQVAALWWGGLPDDMDTTRQLTVDQSAWGDYQWAVEHLKGRSLASRVIPAVDAEEQIVFMRFVPEVSRSSRVFEAYQAPMTFLTLVRVDDGTWRVWGLGPGIPAARDVLGP